MKLFHKPLSILLLIFSALLSFELAAQDGEEEKIIQTIQDELKAFMEKDQARWESRWVHADYVKIIFASAGYYDEISSWDSLLASRQKYFDSPEKPTVKIEKDDINVRVNGNSAVVYLRSKFIGGPFGPDEHQETVILEKVGGDWKVSEIFSITASSYDANDANIEANLNTQGYNLLTLKKNAQALKVFQLNTELYPGAWNTWDSLAEVYMIMGDNKKAVQYYEKSLALNAKNDNAKKYLTKLKEKKK